MDKTFSMHWYESNSYTISVEQPDDIEIDLVENILVRTGLTWRRVETSGGPLWIQ
jgi:hypothetical protein